MAKKKIDKSRAAFTLIEAMVAVMIISVVVIALFQMHSNNTHVFSLIKKQSRTNQYASFLIAHDDYGFENKNIHLSDLLKDFRLEDKLRIQLKNTKATLIYQKLQQVDLSKQKDTDNLDMFLEAGKSVLKVDGSSTSLLRLRIP
ncbi:MAG: prepilin-type N-terminal cleavage/methylation domain-containing protein [Sulfurospirillaceae bacterium]|nr:prepilin-type N-terminal cleavage/methylation domain-containing protein [Sulfurospirillaceae bacterium]